MIVVRSAIKKIVFISIVLISTLMHLKHFNKELVSIHVWRQTQTQSTINNFYEENMNILTPLQNNRGNTEGVFRMEFPLMQWLVACLYKVFGQHLIITRIFMFITGIFSVFGMFSLLKTVFKNEIIALMGCWAFNFSPSFYYHTINPLPDNFSLALGIWGLVLFFNYYNNKSLVSLIFCGILLSLSTLCKLPFIIFFTIPIIYFIKNGRTLKTFIHFALLSIPIIMPLAWYISVIPQWDGNIVIKGIMGENMFASIAKYSLETLISTLPEMIINYGSLLFFIYGLYLFFKRKAYKDDRSFMLIAFGTVCLFYYFYESTAIASIHDYYLFPFYPLLFILVAYGAYSLFNSSLKSLRIISIVLLCILPLTCFLRMRERWDTVSPGFNKDLLIYKNELRNSVPKNALVVAGNDESGFIFFYYIDKKGWRFDCDRLNKENLIQMIANGAQYLYSDSEKINSDAEINNLVESLIFNKGSIKIFKLKNSGDLKK